MAKIYSGLTAGIKLTQDSAQDIAFLTGFELEISQEVFEAKTLGDKWTRKFPGIKTWSGSCEGLFTLDENQKKLLNQLLADSADEVLNLLRRMNGTEESTPSPKTPSKGNAQPALPSHEKAASRLFSFRSLREVSRLARVIGTCRGNNTLYKDETGGNYLLLITPEELEPADFNRICSLISEYGRPEKTVNSAKAYLEEHFEPLIKDSAVETLAQI